MVWVLDRATVLVVVIWLVNDRVKGIAWVAVDFVLLAEVTTQPVPTMTSNAGEVASAEATKPPMTITVNPTAAAMYAFPDLRDREAFKLMKAIEQGSLSAARLNKKVGPIGAGPAAERQSPSRS